VNTDVVAVNDESLFNTPGDAATVNILTNDTLSNGVLAIDNDVVDASVEIVLTGSEVGAPHELEVLGEGTWEYDPLTGILTFTPEVGFYQDPTPITYTLTDTSTGLSDTAVVTVDYLPVAVDDDSLLNAPGVVVVDVL